VGKASSAKKIATAAERGRNQRVRQARGRVYPLALGAAIVLGLLLVGWSRNSARAIANVAPKASAGTTLGDHWHAAFGVYKCDTWLPNITKVNEARETQSGPVTDPDYAVTGIHSHGDGVIHIHPFGAQGAGKNAKLGTYLRMVGAKLSDSKLEMPENLGTLNNDEDCGGKPGKLKLLVWDKADSTDEPAKYVTDFNNVRFKKDGMAFAIAFVNEDTDVKGLKPPSATNLAELGAADGGARPPTTEVVDPSATTVAGSASTAAPTGSTAAPTATSAAPTSSSSSA
jgi:hypothetical protein